VTFRPSLAVVISDLGGGGAQKVLIQMLGAWKARGHRIVVVTLSEGQDDFFTLPNGIERIALNSTGTSTGFFDAISNNILRISEIRRVIKQVRTDLVISFIGTTNVLTVAATRFLPTKVVVSERNDPSRQSLGRFWDFLRKKLYPLADIVTANSPGALQVMADYVPADQLMLVPNPISSPNNYATINFQKPQLLAVGRLYPQKAYDILIRALAESHIRDFGWGLTILGDGPLASELRSLADSIGVSDLINWEGHVSDPYPYYNSASAFVMASRYEGVPNALLEAMGTGIPCIVSDSIDGVSDLIIHEETGLLVQTDNSQYLAKMMDRVMAMSDQGKNIGQQGKKKVLSNMSMQKAIDSWQLVFNKLADC